MDFYQIKVLTKLAQSKETYLVRADGVEISKILESTESEVLSAKKLPHSEIYDGYQANEANVYDVKMQKYNEMENGDYKTSTVQIFIAAISLFDAINKIKTCNIMPQTVDAEIVSIKLFKFDQYVHLS